MRLALLALVPFSVQFCARAAEQQLTDTTSTDALVTEELFLLPSGYRGPVVIIYDQRNGTSPISRNQGKITYEVPQSGIVKSRSGEPPLGTKVSAAFRNTPNAPLRTFGSCEEMRLTRTAADPAATCWIDSIQGSDIPPHVVFIVTDWSTIPENYARASLVLDSVVFKGRFPGVLKWEEPSVNTPQKKTSTL
jgi:hypothetical protein